MKLSINNETKIGVLAVIALCLLFWGFNFLKGKRFDATNTIHYLKVNNIKGLKKGNVVTINGTQVGMVNDIITSRDMRDLKVKIVLDKEVDIPIDSRAKINKNPVMGTADVEILLGADTKNFIKDGETIKNDSSIDITQKISNAIDDKVDPVLNQATKTLNSIDGLSNNFNSALTPALKNNLDASMAEFRKITISLNQLTNELNGLMSSNTAVVNSSLKNVQSLTETLKAQTSSIKTTMANTSKITENLKLTTSKLSEIELKQTTDKLNSTMDEFKKSANSLNDLLVNINKQEGSLGLLMKDQKMYWNLNATVNKLNTLLDDFKTNPKRYINVSVFGKKDKSKPLAVPLPDTINAPYIKEK